jgi:hypothetical protein
MRLRDFLLLGLAAVAILNSQGAFARDGDKVYRLGILSPAAGPVQRIRATALPELARPAKATKPSKKARKAASGQKEMLMPITGKKAKESPAKKSASKPQRKSA